MASGLERVPDNLKKQLAIAVRSIQWSYAIFWSISATQPGVLEWGDGYYNGDIKTRKTIQSVEVNADQLGLQRSEQLRELYESLSMAETSPQARRPSAALSPEDLTDTEWYYLVCMSFTFNSGQGLPGRSLASGQPVWLSNAQYADSKVFSRSLLAKSATIQTVVCFPYMRGVIELGVTEMVLEDPSLIHHIKTSFLDIPYSAVTKNCTRIDRLVGSAALDNEITDTELVPAMAYEDLNKTSPNSSSDFQAAEDSFMVEGINGVASQVQSWQFMDDDLNNCVHHSVNSSDCVSQAVVDPVRGFPGSNESKVDKCLKDVQEFNHSKLSALDLQKDDLHYQTVLSSLLKCSHPLILGPNFRNCRQGSSFSSWKKVGLMHSQKLKGGSSQEMLKKIVSEVPRMHDRGLLELPEDDDYGAGVLRPEADGIATSHVLSERRRREKMNEKFMILKSIIPSISKVDKVTILDDTIQYLQQLERRVEELESHRESADVEVKTKRKPQDAAERTSDNYGSIKTGNVKRPSINKRKASDIDEPEPERDSSADNITINMNDKEVTIEIKCPWRDGRLLEIMDALSQLHIDSYSVQSSNTEGILSLTIKSKHKGLASISAGTIRKTLQKVAWKC